MRNLILVLFVSWIMVNPSNAQNKFHRNYPPVDNKENTTISAIQLKDGTYASLDYNVTRDFDNNLFSDTIVITTYKPKGDILWSKSISIDSQKGGLFISDGSIVQGDNDSLYYSLQTLGKDGPNKIIGSISAGGGVGNVLHSYSVISNVIDSFSAANLLVNFNHSLMNIYSGGDENESNLVLSRKNYNGKTLWTKLLNAKNPNGENVSDNVTQFRPMFDGNFMMTGVIDSLSNIPYLTVMDSIGNIKFSKYYLDVEAFLGFPVPQDVAVLSDTSYVIAGYGFEINQSFDIFIRGFVLKTDKIGNIEWSKKIIFNEQDFSIVRNVVVDKNDNIFIGGANVDLANGNAYNFILNLKEDGTSKWQKKYPKVNDAFLTLGNMFPTKEGGLASFVNIAEDDKIITSFIKTDDKGETTCEENIDENILVDNSYLSDTLLWEVTDTTTFEDIVGQTNDNFVYDVPKVSLDVRPFCPNEPIDWTFHAKTKGATYYKWSTGVEGPTMDTLRVMEEGEYSVMVTIGEGVCFTLCDTAMLARYELPQVGLGLSLGNFCTNGKQRIDAFYQPGNTEGWKTITWSTGETNVTSIEIATPGTYKVTLVDKCDETAIAELMVGEFPRKITAANIVSSVTTDCNTNTTQGNLTASGNSSFLGEEKYVWSNGTKSKTTSISSESTYTVTITDGCGTTASKSITLEFLGEAKNGVSITTNNDSLCSQQYVILNAVTDKIINKSDYYWTTGETTPNIFIKEEGSYTVTVTDFCGNQFTKTIDVKFNEILTGDTLRYAHVFFPDGLGVRFGSGGGGGTTVSDSTDFKALQLNRSFGPIKTEISCFSQISDYDFRVFNRWGQEVFKSNDVEIEWEPRTEDKPSPSDTYLWVVKYVIFGHEKILKGDVTLIR